MIKNINTNYIEPNLGIYKNAEELIKSPENKSNIFFNDLLKEQKIFLIGEPGYGKTRLLKEYLVRSGKDAIFLDLKKIGNQSIEQYIIDRIDDFRVIDTTEYNKIDLLKTKNFQLRNSNEILFCFDALDEVKNEDLSRAVEDIRSFVNKYNKANLIISCRNSYLSKWQHLFSESNFSYIGVNHLELKQIESFLKPFGIKESEVENLIKRVPLNVIQVPRYLEMIAKLVEEEGVDKLSNISRAELFERFIYHKLDTESKKHNSLDKKNIIKIILEKLALVMEIYQANRITKDELMRFFDDIKSNLVSPFILSNNNLLNLLYERSLLKDDLDTIEFENTEFQEYLAAKEITRLGNTEQIIFDLAIVPELKEVHPSWLNTLSFVVELNIGSLRKLLEYVFANKENITTKSHIKLLTDIGLDKLSEEDRRSIFKIIYSYYQDIGHWIDYDVARKLSFYYDSSLYDYIEDFLKLKNIPEEIQDVIKANSCILIGYLVEYELLDVIQQNQWKERLQKIIEDKKNGVVLRKAFFALGKFKNLELFTKSIIDTAFSFDDHAITSLIYALRDINPDSPIAYECFLRAIERKDDFSARNALYQVKKKESLTEIIKQISNNKSILERFTKSNVYEKDYDVFIEKVRDVIDDDIVKYIKEIVSKSLLENEYYGGDSTFVEKLVLLINDFSKDYIFELIEECKDERRIFSYQNIFSKLLTKQDVEKFVEVFNTISPAEPWIVFSVLRHVRDSGRNDKDEIYEEGRKYLKDEYEQEELRRVQVVNDQDKRKLKLYNNFKFKLEPKKDKYYPDVFKFYIKNKDILELYITEGDKSRLQELITKYVLDHFDPGDQKLTQKSEGGTNTVTSNSCTFIFGDCIKVANLLNVDLKEYRQKILNYIPYAFDNDHEALDVIFSIVINPTEHELNNVLKNLKDRDDDLVHYRPSNTINVIEKYKLTNGISLLKNDFINSDKMELYYKERALEVIANLTKNEQEDKEYFKSIFNNQTNQIKQNHRSLSEKANEILITKFKDDDAIKWRFQEIVNRAFPLQEQENGFVSENRMETYDKKFAKPLTNLKDLKYKTQFLKLFDESFIILQKGDNYWIYVQYMWSVIIDYFKNIKEFRDYKILDDLGREIRKKYLAKEKNINWFSYRYEELKLEYIGYIGKPQNISDCIKKYNDFKEKVYIPISTPRDLFELIKKVINEDLRKWVEKEGAYKFISEYKKVQNGKIIKRQSSEDLIQKTIKTQFENCLLRAGLRANEVNIHRESQLLDDKRTDFLISYGLVGAILIEIKLTNNSEIKNKSEREEYKKKLIQYVDGTKSDYGLFVILQRDVDKHKLSKYLPELEKLYITEENIDVVGLNCSG